MVALAITIFAITAACTSSGNNTTSTLTTSIPSATTSTPTTATIPPTTTTTSTTTTTTTVPPTTTTTTTTTNLPADPPPEKVTGVTVGIGGGSGEVYVQWAASPAGDLDHYSLSYSENSGGSKVHLADVPAGTTEYIDFPRELTPGINCYVIKAVDAGGNASSGSDEVCLSIT